MPAVDAGGFPQVQYKDDTNGDCRGSGFSLHSGGLGSKADRNGNGLICVKNDNYA